ncbi:MAG: 4-alpha-glucanotransferase, partial [Clostridia bacterium]|nr:4-alpha-glucanotransferase [Clostridia bacterium]
MNRSSGVLMHVSSLWGGYSEGSFGTSAMEFIDFLADGGFSVWQVLPFCLPDECNSPYKSFSAFSGNPYFIDLTDLHKMGLLTAEELKSAEQRTPYACEFKRLAEERIALLERAAARFDGDETLDAFYESHPHTDKFCRFMALKEANGGKEWINWTVDTPNEQTYRTWRFMEYIFFVQWARVKAYANSKGISIVGDLPIYVAHDSSDVWSAPHLFHLDKRNLPTSVAGVPPDYFSADGQLWGNPLYNWDEMAKDGYAWWKERISFMCELFDGVRIDHFRAFESYFSIPAGEKTARNGKWVKGPGMALIGALKSVCGDKLLIAEYLGDITPEVVKLVKDSGFPGMKILQFAFLGDENSPHLPHNYIENAVAYTGTHDNNTLLGYIWELDPPTRKRFFDYCGFEGDNWDKSRDAILRTMLQSRAALVIFPIQDLLFYGKDTRINVPGKADDNWS